MITDDKKNTLDLEVKDLEEQKTREEKKYKIQMTKLDNQMKQMTHELSILSVKLKEKDTEVKLNELKIKELRKQVPNNKLKPLPRKDKANMSVDAKLHAENDQEPLIVEEQPQKKQMSSKPK